MPIQRTTMIDDDGSGLTGTILNNAWLQTIYGQIDTAIGLYADIAFNAAHFTAPAGSTFTVTAAQAVTWGGVRSANNTGTLFLHIDNAVITGAPAYLFVTLPPTLAATRTAGVSMPFKNGAASGTGFCLVDPGSQRLFLGVDAGLATPWQPNPISLRLVVTYPISASGLVIVGDGGSDLGDQSLPRP